MKRRRAATTTGTTTVGLISRLVPNVIMFATFAALLATTTLREHDGYDLLIPICGLLLTMLNCWETALMHHAERDLRRRLVHASARADYAEAAADQWQRRYTEHTR